jgi:hypothetical protein
LAHAKLRNWDKEIEVEEEQQQEQEYDWDSGMGCTGWHVIDGF